MAERTMLIGDIGGTNARFALADQSAPGFSREETLQCADFPSAEAAVRHYLESVSAPAPDVICLAAAGPVIDKRVDITNNHWVLSARDLAATFSTQAVRLLNDFEAIAYSIPSLNLVGSEDYSIAVLGPGTGLGTAGLRKQGKSLEVIPSEAGHTSFASETELQREILDVLNAKFDRVSFEHLVSGPGIENIHWALGQRRFPESPAHSAAEIFADDSYHSMQAVGVFFEVLGQFSRDFALSLGAYDGVFIAGGIVPRYPELLQKSRFRASFENRPGDQTDISKIPTQLVSHPQPGLLGASYVALESLRGTEVMPTS
jgi:glucokinase